MISRGTKTVFADFAFSHSRPHTCLVPRLVHILSILSFQGLGFLYSTGVGVTSNQAKVRMSMSQGLV